MALFQVNSIISGVNLLRCRHKSLIPTDMDVFAVSEGDSVLQYIDNQ